ncbi:MULTISPECIES: hypothetical protein [unclassified Streptomyces]|uniref:hypothetical protein n=1 Tax=unclassified Streptomyces TaxID=2593676 RepID=UPI002442E38B|nr:hypothetical protein [Streptomyces sp. DH41]MDG9726743.1 hypothetical protein [Streptomyces sp. DH41]
MRPARRAAPTPVRATGHRLAATLTALLAVLLALVPAGPAAAGAPVAVVGQVPVPAATTVPHPDTGYHADDGCATACAAQARSRHDHLGERPAAPDRLATTTRSTGPAPAARGRTAAPSGSVPVSPGRTSHDRVRAPPVSSGT